MARQLWLLRHADAEPHGTRPDSERRLTERGERQARLAGAALARMRTAFQVVLSSPKERALRTATLALQTWGEQAPAGAAPESLEIHAPLGSDFDAARALAAIAELDPDGRLLVVGHEPDLSGVVAELTGARIDLKKGGLAVVRLGPTVRPSGSNGLSASAAGELVLLLRPAELALIADVAAIGV
jgi:phosphohistidine phosphatase